MALALYRKYRPRTFAEVIGQDHVTEPLSQALRSGRLNHAYLFSGPRGCGKTSSARILARSLNCERGPTPEPCGVCDSCRALAPDGSGSIDVIEIDAASHGGVDDARELRERAFFAPAASRFKIYVIDEAHMVSTQGFNALLKLVEEPPDYVKFIFATTEPDKVLGTIKSRTHHYPFRLIPPGILRPYLEQLADAENAKVDPAVFPLVVRAGAGSARDSLSVLDQLIAGAGPEGVSYSRAVALLGVTDAALIDEMCDALAAGDGAAAYATIDRVAEAGHDPRRFASDLLERLRDLIVMQQVPEAAAKGLIDGPADQLERMSAQTQRLGPATLSRSADIVHNGLIEMRGTTAPRLLLELITARMLLPTADKGESGLLQRVERMERRLSLGGDFESGEPDDDYSGPAVLAGRGSSSGNRPQAGPGAGAGSAAADGGVESGGGGSRSAGGGAAAARAAAAAAASRSGGARRGDAGSTDNAAGNGGDPGLAAGRAGGARRGDAGSTDNSAGNGGAPGLAAGRAGGARRTEVVPADDVAGSGGDPGLADGARRTEVVPADDVAGSGGDPGLAAGRAGGARRAEVVAADDVVGSSGDPGLAAVGARRTEVVPADDLAGNGGGPVPSDLPGDDLAAAGDVAGSGEWPSQADRAGEDVGSADDAPGRGGDPRSAAPQADLGPASSAESVARANGRAAEDSDETADGDSRPPRRVPPQAVMADPATPDPVIPEAAAPGALDAAAVRRVWDEIVAMVRVNNKRIAALASEATVRDIDGDTLVLTFRHAFHARTLAESPEPVVDAIYEVLGGRWQIRCELAGDQRGAAGPPPARPTAAREPSGGNAPAAARETNVNAPAASGSAPGRERRGREHSSNGQGESGASGDRSDEDHPAVPSARAVQDADPPPSELAEERVAPADPAVLGDGPDEADRGPVGNVSAQDPGRPGPAAEQAPAQNGQGAGDAARTSGRQGESGPSTPTGPDRRDTVANADDEDDWPETALPGGLSADAGDSDWPETPPTTFAVPQARNEPAESPTPVVAAAATATIGGAVTATKPAKSAPGSVGAAAAARAAARAAAGGRAKPAAAQADVEFAGEPPFDPDYDGPGKGAERKAKFEGFDPGDEPTDEVIDERTARQSSEQQAFALLHEALGAERIGEIDLK
ncbi:DNA polymerase-3 subunit gamma/tau [Asanoa ferruginea]|uniref:DNA polymerase III subunit gamma/tau n=1 Tax=Asanoa ferruginea TaxID=53367 RepID=A0A3D9ZKS4_9ACTN|nr:DNA polymerase III subunit gamma and tau [Asanoa ferruginea]REF96533.1 DNA polymerase-3 subunit gamma/tau [Asanoa ferruginea]GIF53595.1 hypothetical protein Afe04nite_81340 [Asanoa ferruginea]